MALGPYLLNWGGQKIHTKCLLKFWLPYPPPPAGLDFLKLQKHITGPFLAELMLIWSGSNLKPCIHERIAYTLRCFACSAYLAQD